MLTFNVAVYALAVITCATCMILLFRGYLRNGLPLLLWSSLFFVALTLSNLLLFIDLAMLPEIDLRIYRLATALIGMLFLLYGFICESE